MPELKNNMVITNGIWCMRMPFYFFTCGTFKFVLFVFIVENDTMS